MELSVKFDGRDLQKALAALPARVSKTIQRQALNVAAEPMRERMSDLAPHEPGKPDLKDNIVISNARGEDEEETAVAVGPNKNAFYGKFQEFGTAFHGAQPFARPAFDSVHLTSLRILSVELWNRIKARGGSTRAQSSGGGLL